MAIQRFNNSLLSSRYFPSDLNHAFLYESVPDLHIQPSLIFIVLNWTGISSPNLGTMLLCQVFVLFNVSDFQARLFLYLRESICKHAIVNIIISILYFQICDLIMKEQFFNERQSDAGSNVMRKICKQKNNGLK